MQARGEDGVVRSVSLFVSSGREGSQIVSDTAAIPSALQMDIEKRVKNSEIKVARGKQSLRCVGIAKKASFEEARVAVRFSSDLSAVRGTRLKYLNSNRAQRVTHNAFGSGRIGPTVGERAFNGDSLHAKSHSVCCGDL